MSKKYETQVESARSAAMLSILSRNGHIALENRDFKMRFGKLGFSKSALLTRINYLAERGLLIVRRTGESIRVVLTDGGRKFLEEN